MKFQEKMKKLCACGQAIDWIDDKSFITAWKECPYGTWLHWLVDELNCKGLLSDDLYNQTEAALCQKGTNLSPADRIRNVIPSNSVQRAVYKLKF